MITVKLIPGGTLIECKPGEFSDLFAGADEDRQKEQFTWRRTGYKKH